MGSGRQVHSRPIGSSTPVRFLGTVKVQRRNYCRKFTYRKDASDYKNEVVNFAEWAFFTKHGGFWTVVYFAEGPYKTGDKEAFEGVDF